MRYIAFLVALMTAIPAVAQTGLPPAPYANKQLADPAKESEARALMDELRCLKCQSQSIADSNAPMAGDMRSQVRERIEAGQTPDQVRDWLIERYGSWVSYDPPVNPMTWPLWAAPIILLLLALWLVRGRFKRRKTKMGQGQG